MDALIFDFDGVVVDSEPVHLMGFQKVLRTVGVPFSHDEYYGEYLGYDDHDCLQMAARDHGVNLEESQIAELTATKTALIQQTYATSVEPLPGVVDLITSAAAGGVPLAVCSGALRDEIVLAARTLGVLEHFTTMVSAEDVRRGKPDPEGYRLTWSRLVEATGRRLSPARCIVFEDSPAGIEAAKEVGMKVVAITNSYPAEALSAADRIVRTLTEVSLSSLELLLEGLKV